MASAKFVLALDSGSQSSRALLFDAKGDVVGKGQLAHAAMRHPAPGAVEQNPIDIRDCLFGSISLCLKEWGGDPKDIVGAALTTQRSTVLPVDPEGVPLQDAISWLDRRTADFSKDRSLLVRILIGILGKNSLIPRLLAKSFARQLRERNPEIIDKLGKILPVEGWLHHQLTGRMAVAPGGVIGTWPFDVKKRTWNKPGLMHKLLAFEPEWLPEIVEAGNELGRLTADAARKTGLPEGLPFFACGGDKQAEVLGAGVRAGEANVAAVSLGTGSSICLLRRKPVESGKYDWLTMAAAEAGVWSMEYLLFRGMWTARWFAQELGRDLIIEAEKSGCYVEELLVAEAMQVPAGSDGLMTLPRWSPTLQFPMETGTLIGLRETHNRGHIFRSLLEGIGFDLRRGLGILEKAVGSRVDAVHVGGGGARSELVVQILSDILGLPVYRPSSEELAARGAAILAATGARVHENLDASVEAMVPGAPVVEPDSLRHALYDEIYKQVYLPSLKTVRGLSGKLMGVLKPLP